MDDDAPVTRSEGNIFADLGLPDAEDRMRKAQLALAITNRIKDLGLSQSAAAGRMGIAQPDVSKLLHGRLAGFSLTRLLECIRALGSDITISVTPARPDQEGRMLVEVA